MKKLNCFIACSFGNNDVDNICDNSIIPILKDLNINYKRVDRITHNDNIDFKIIELIKKSDFGIADLTYARPSVYYEAGYLNGMNKQVIYIARADHFIHDSKDINGNRRIHFDLITKNIIQWNSNDNFPKTLKDRIKFIITPIRKNVVSINKLKETESQFLKKSINDRLNLIQKQAVKLLKSNGYWVIQSRLNRKHSIAYIPKDQDRIFLFLFDNRFNKNDLQYFSSSFYSLSFLETLDVDINKIKEEVKVFNSLKPVTNSTIESALQIFENIHEKVYYYKGKNQISRYIFLDNIKSEISYKENLINTLEEITYNS